MSKHVFTTITCNRLGCQSKLVIHLPLKEAWELAKRQHGWKSGMEWGKRVDHCPLHLGGSK